MSPGLTPRLRETCYLLESATYRLGWTEWGDPAAPIVVCVHGLTRQGRDFDVLAAALADRFRVVCADLPGRGRSEWLPHAGLYSLPTYVVALAALLDALARPVAWVGTSLGGLCGMALAAADARAIARLVLNDIGPFVPAAALRRIASYLAEVPASFEGVAEIETYLRRVHAPFGVLSDAHWAAMARHSARPLRDGRWALHYDPRIAEHAVASEPVDVDLWEPWGRIAVPRLVLRGETSDLLTSPVLARMATEGAATHVVAGAGHAPALMDAATVGVVRRFVGALKGSGGEGDR